MSERWERDPGDPASWPRLFTVSEANALLPEIVPLLMEIRARKSSSIRPLPSWRS